MSLKQDTSILTLQAGLPKKCDKFRLKVGNGSRIGGFKIRKVYENVDKTEDMTNNTVEVKCWQVVCAHWGIHKLYKSEESGQGLSIEDYKYYKVTFESRDMCKPVCRAGSLPLDKGF